MSKYRKLIGWKLNSKKELIRFIKAGINLPGIKDGTKDSKY